MRLDVHCRQSDFTCPRSDLVDIDDGNDDDDDDDDRNLFKDLDSGSDLSLNDL